MKFGEGASRVKPVVIPYPEGLRHTLKLLAERFGAALGFGAATRLYARGSFQPATSRSRAGMDRLTFLACLMPVGIPAINLLGEEVAAAIIATQELHR